MWGEIILAAWSAAGLGWWLVAWRLVSAPSPTSDDVPPSAKTLPLLSIFKPLPPLNSRSLRIFGPALESFVAQLDSDSELLLGIHEADRARTAALVDDFRAKYPTAKVKVIFRSGPDEMANPKIAWQKILARDAEGELWLWSDSDIIAPSGFLQCARREFARSDAAMMTYPYRVGHFSARAGLLEALFVNAEFYPGVLLLRERGAVDFGLGAGMLFRRDDFYRRVDWADIGARLADDFSLGQVLQPVRIGSATLATAVASSNWKEALLHDLRWSKTIRWNRPIGFFSRLLILPVTGWIGAVALHPTSFFAWLGLLGMVQAEVFFAAAMCRRMGCRLDWKDAPGLEFWSPWRVVLWILSWLPVPVLWSGKKWSKPMVKFDDEIRLGRERRMPLTR
jgi:ceramide glucosyltransferase